MKWLAHIILLFPVFLLGCSPEDMPTPPKKMNISQGICLDLTMLKVRILIGFW